MKNTLLNKMLNIWRFRAECAVNRVTDTASRYRSWKNHVLISTAAVATGVAVVVSMTGVRIFNDTEFRGGSSPPTESEQEQIEPEQETVIDDEQLSDENARQPIVVYRDRVISEPLPYDTVYEYCNFIVKGEEVISAEGVYGERAFTVRETLVDGEVVASEVMGRFFNAEPQSKVITRGLAPAVTEATTAGEPTRRLEPGIPVSLLAPEEIILDENGRPVNYERLLTGRATAYTAGATARTSTGVLPEIGMVAVDPRIIPYGSLLYIKTACGTYVYGAAVAQDTGAFIHYNNNVIVDVFMGLMTPENRAEAFRWGVRDVEVYVIR
jgi:3D (Asp-Asp-Asp) domain-containing protein